jgi:hypothetical protein
VSDPPEPPTPIDRLHGAVLHAKQQRGNPAGALRGLINACHGAVVRADGAAWAPALKTATQDAMRCRDNGGDAGEALGLLIDACADIIGGS